MRIVEDVDKLISELRLSHHAFAVNTIDLNVSAYRIPNRSVFYSQLNQAHRKSKNIRVRQSYAPGHDKDRIEIGIGQLWVSLAHWLYKRYKSARSSLCSPVGPCISTSSRMSLTVVLRVCIAISSKNICANAKLPTTTFG